MHLTALQRPAPSRALAALLRAEYPELAEQLAGKPASEAAPAPFPPLESLTRPTVPTDQAAYYLDRAQQTMRIWASRECGPIRPLRVNGRLHWPVSELRRVLGVAA